MRKFTFLFVLLMMMAIAITPALAQEDPTEEPTSEPTSDVTVEPTTEATVETTDAAAEMTAEATADFPSVPVVLVRLAHFASDAPALAPFINGEPSGIQGLEFPSMSGWVEVPAGSALTLVPQSDTSAAPVVGPIVLDNSSSWSTLAVVGSAGDLSVYAIRENLSAIPTGCALVTVFHGIEGGPTFDVVGSEGTTFVSGIGFPGSDAGGIVGDTVGQCAPSSAAQATEDVMTGTEDPLATEEAMMDDMSTASVANVGAVDCVLLPTSMDTGTGDLPTDMTVTEGAATGTEDASATEEASTANTAVSTSSQSMSGGQTVSNCAYSFLVPAGLASLSANGADGSTLFGLSSSAVEANTYYFYAVIGTTDAPQVFSYAVSGDNLMGLMTGDESDDMSDSEMDATLEVTPEATEAS
jgi:hypothetical protein